MFLDFVARGCHFTVMSELLCHVLSFPKPDSTMTTDYNMTPDSKMTLRMTKNDSGGSSRTTRKLPQNDKQTTQKHTKNENASGHAPGNCVPRASASPGSTGAPLCLFLYFLMFSNIFCHLVEANLIHYKNYQRMPPMLNMTRHDQQMTTGNDNKMTRKWQGSTRIPSKTTTGNDKKMTNQNK